MQNIGIPVVTNLLIYFWKEQQPNINNTLNINNTSKNTELFIFIVDSVKLGGGEYISFLFGPWIFLLEICCKFLASRGYFMAKFAKFPQNPSCIPVLIYQFFKLSSLLLGRVVENENLFILLIAIEIQTFKMNHSKLLWKIYAALTIF